MPDSLEIFFPVDKLTEHEYTHARHPHNSLIDCDQDGVLAKPFYRWMIARSPLTRAKFKIKAVPLSGAIHGRIAGYIVKINIPACVTGNNLLLENGVPQGCQLAGLLLQNWMLDNACTKLGVHSLQLGKARLLSATPTYLFKCLDKADAHAARREFFHQVAGVSNNKKSPGRKKKKSVFQVGDLEEATVYAKHREFDIDGYVKDGEGDGSFRIFPSPEVEEAVYAEAGVYLRLGVKLKGVWLIKHGKDNPESWRLGADNNPYAVGVEIIRKYLKLDVGLRSRLPKDSTAAKLNENDQAILRWHLEGNDAREHPSILAKEPRLSQQQYFSAVKERILRVVKVDVSIPWLKQSKELSPRLAELLVFSGQYEPPAHLADYVYSRSSVPAAINKLKEMIRAKMPKGIGSVYVPPEDDDVSSIDDTPPDQPDFPAKPWQTKGGAGMRGISNAPLDPDAS